MRKLALCLALASSAFASPSLARDDSFYLEGGFGPLLAQDVTYARATGTDTRTIVADASRGVDGNLLFGYDFGKFRLEAEAGYKQFGVDELVATAGVRCTATTNCIGTYTNVDGQNKVYSAMLNGLIDFGGNDGIGLSVGGGVGWAGVHSDLTAFSTGPGFIEDKDSGFAYQGIVQVRQPISENVDVGLKYRYFRMDEIEFVDQAGRLFNTNLQTHSILGTLGVNFGGAEPLPPVMAPVIAPPPPPPPPPPPAPTTRVCPDGTVVGMEQACPVPPPPVVPRAGERG